LLRQCWPLGEANPKIACPALSSSASDLEFDLGANGTTASAIAAPRLNWVPLHFPKH
jgi:hypothetical protein